MSIREFLRRWDQGDFSAPDHATIVAAGWYDWFCTDRGLPGRLKKMVPAVRRIARSDKINQDTMYVWFKNNCPCWVDETYDDFRISDLETGDLFYTIVPRYPAIIPGTPNKAWCYAKSDIGYVSEIWDFVADEETKTAHHIENLVQGKPVDHPECVVYGARKEMYNYFGV